MIKLLIATPAYDGKVSTQYAISLSETCAYLASKGIAVELYIPQGGSLLVAERNRILKKFMESDCTHILMIDNDIGWPVMSVEGLLKHNVDFAAGCYPARLEKSFLFRPFYNENGSLATNGISLIKMQYIPAGFMLLRKSVIEKMQNDNPELYFKPKEGDGIDGFALFNTEVHEGEFWGEDYTFCRLARKSGFDIWVDPMIQFNHAGNVGMLAEVLTDKKEDSAEIVN